jgi:hypothetical protein
MLNHHAGEDTKTFNAYGPHIRGWITGARTLAESAPGNRAVSIPSELVHEQSIPNKSAWSASWQCVINAPGPIISVKRADTSTHRKHLDSSYPIIPSGPVANHLSFLTDQSCADFLIGGARTKTAIRFHKHIGLSTERLGKGVVVAVCVVVGMVVMVASAK